MAKKEGKSNILGSWAFIIGVALAIILGFIGASLPGQIDQWLTVAIIVVGLIVGLFNITRQEAMSFLTISAILIVVMYAGSQTITAVAQNQALSIALAILQKLNLLLVPATIVVAVKSLFRLARD